VVTQRSNQIYYPEDSGEQAGQIRAKRTLSNRRYPPLTEAFGAFTLGRRTHAAELLRPL
jgi:hypothetical protein